MGWKKKEEAVVGAALINHECPVAAVPRSCLLLLLLSLLMFSVPITTRILPTTSRLVSNRLSLLQNSRNNLLNRAPRFQSTQNIFRSIATMSSPTVKLNSGYDMPLVGFGLWKVDNETCADTVYNAIKAGYRLLDGACGTFAIDSPIQQEKRRKRRWRIAGDVEAQRRFTWCQCPSTPTIAEPCTLGLNSPSNAPPTRSQDNRCSTCEYYSGPLCILPSETPRIILLGTSYRMGGAHA